MRIQRRGLPPQTKTFISKADAIRWSRETELALERGDFHGRVEADRTTLYDALDRYRRELTPQKKGAQPETYRIAVLMRSSLAKLSLSAIRSTDLARYRDTRRAAANTIKNELNTLSAVFETCRQEWGIQVVNPVRGLKRPRSPRGRERRLLPGEEVPLMTACRRSRAQYLPLAVTLALETGMRLGELARLYWEHIDLSRQVAHLPDTKNGSARTVPLSTTAVTALGTLPCRDAGAVFPVGVDAIKQSFRAAMVRGRQQYIADRLAAGMSEDALRCDRMLTGLHFHDLRHEAVSRLFERGLNPIEVATISGHKTLAMLKRYTHLRAENLINKLG